MELPSLLLVFATLLLLFLNNACPLETNSHGPRKPIILDRSGGFSIGGKVVNSPMSPNSTLSCDHGYVEYFIPQTPRKTSIVMWHSSSTQTWQNRWDGGEGYKDMFLRRDYPVYLWDGPRIGRANWACEPYTYQPDYRDQGNFVAWNLGPRFGQFWPGSQFPTESDEAWQQATSNRYIEFDTTFNVELETDAAAIAADSGKLGKNIVYLTNSASGLRSLLTVIKSNTTNIKAIVHYEGYGQVFPDNLNITGGTGATFGPWIVPVEKFKKLARLEAIQWLWGDNRDESFPFLSQSRLATKLVNMYGGNSEVLKLGDDVGLTGTSHIAFADMDNNKVARLLDRFLERNGLDGYEEDA